MKNKKTAGEMTESTVKARKKKRRKMPVIIAVIAVLLIVIRVAARSGAAQSGAFVTTTSVIRGDIEETITTSGTVQSEDVKVVFAPVSGILAKVNVKAGEAVKAGTLLAEYDMEKWDETLRQSELQLQRSVASYDGVMTNSSKSSGKLSEAEINLGVLNQQLNDYRAYLKKLQSSLDDYMRENSNALSVENVKLQEQLRDLTPGTDEYNSVSSALAWNSNLQQNLSNTDFVVNMNKEIAEVQEHIANCEEYKARMEAQKSSSEATVLDSYSITQYNADYEMARLSYESTEKDYNLAKEGIKAEFDGIVTEISMAVGTGAGISEGMQLLILQNSANLKVSFDASKYDIQKIELGQKADVVILGKKYQGQISKIDRMAVNNMSNTPMVGVEIHLLDADDNIILGMDAKLTIHTAKAENALLIPVEAINADREGDFLFVAENGVAVRRPIVCGISTDTYAQVLEGVTEEDVIILSSLSDLEDGMAVTVMPLQ